MGDEQTIQMLSDMMQRGFDRLDARLDRVDGRLVDGVQRQAALEARQESLEQSVIALRESIEHLACSEERFRQGAQCPYPPGEEAAVGRFLLDAGVQGLRWVLVATAVAVFLGGIIYLASKEGAIAL